MKDYINYMDNISADPALKNKILKRARSKPTYTSKNRNFLSYAGLVTAAAVLLLGMWVMPGAISSLRPGGPNVDIIHIASPEVNQNSDAPVLYDSFPMETPALTPSVNQDSGAMAGGGESPASIPSSGQALWDDGIISSNSSWEMSQASPPRLDRGLEYYRVSSSPGYPTSWMTFSHVLTEEEFINVFPNLNPSFTASAIYAYDGTLKEVLIFESQPAYNQSLHIRVGKGNIMHSMMLAPYRETQVSYVHGIPVTTLSTGTYPFASFSAAFTLDDIGYFVDIFGAPHESYVWLADIVDSLIIGGAPDLSVLTDPVIPELRNDHITLEDARHDPDFGMFLPANIPGNLTPNMANRWICQHSNFLLMSWDDSIHAHLRWMIRTSEDHHRENIMTAQDFERLERNMRLPVFDGEVSRARRAFAIPVIQIEDLSLDMLESIVIWMDNDASGVSGWWMLSLAVMYGDIVIEINASRLSPEQLWDMLPQMQ